MPHLLIYWLISSFLSLIYDLFIDSSTYIYIYIFTRWFSDLGILSIIYSLNYSFVHLFMYSFIHVFISLFLHLSIICLFTYLFTYLSINPFINSFIYLFTCLLIYSLSIELFIIHRSIYLYI